MSKHEDAFWQEWLRIKPAGWPDPRRGYPFAAEIGRKYEADFAWLAPRVIVECHGGTWGGKSGHNSGGGLARDYERTNIAQRLGWFVLQYEAKALAKRRIEETVREVIEVICERMEGRNDVNLRSMPEPVAGGRTRDLRGVQRRLRAAAARGARQEGRDRREVRTKAT